MHRPSWFTKAISEKSPEEILSEHNKCQSDSERFFDKIEESSLHPVEKVRLQAELLSTRLNMIREFIPQTLSSLANR
jgi:hypothetical protein